MHDEFVDRFLERAAALRLGDPLEPATTMGPLISERHMQRVLEYVKIGRAEGAALVAGGARHGNRGFFVQPTVFTGVQPDMRIAREEIFGPVVTVLRFPDGDEEAALRLANASPYSLAGAVWTADVARAHRSAAGLRAGTVWVNTYGPTDARLPWGGMGGESGIGRDLGRSALDAYTETRTTWIQLGAARAA